VRATPGVAALSSYRALKIELDQRPIALFAVDLAPASQPGVVANRIHGRGRRSAGATNRHTE